MKKIIIFIATMGISFSSFAAKQDVSKNKCEAQKQQVNDTTNSVNPKVEAQKKLIIDAYNNLLEIIEQRKSCSKEEANPVIREVWFNDNGAKTTYLVLQKCPAAFGGRSSTAALITLAPNYSAPKDSLVEDTVISAKALEFDEVMKSLGLEKFLL